MVSISLLLLLLWNTSFSSREEPCHTQVSSRPLLPPGSELLVSYANRFNNLNTSIRDGGIDPRKARTEVAYLLQQIRQLYLQRPDKLPAAGEVFPVQGYNAKAIGGTHGEGYQPGRYNFYHGNKHTGHPAHDIFINDKDQNTLDDKTGKPVNILSVSEGIVVAVEPQWQPGSLLRGGVYVWIYAPRKDHLYYYAHNSRVYVKPGDLVKPGSRIAAMGRTGLNAYKKRSPTYLHLMALKLAREGDLVPVDLYPVLKRHL